MRTLGLFAVLAIALGCWPGAGGAGGTASNAPGAAPAEGGNPLRVEGPGGAVALGDDLEQAKKAFPVPEGAQVFDNSLNFAIFGKDGWAWVQESGQAFEVCLEDGKIIAMAVTNLGDLDGAETVASQKESVGEPTRVAESDNTAVAVWKHGEDARFFVLFKKEFPMLGKGALTIVGPADRLKLLNYHADDPENFVAQIDAALSLGAPGR
jgi:hypothetical protein